MIPRPSEIVRARLYVRAVCVLLGVLVMLLALGPAASWVLEGVSDGDFFEFGYYAPRILTMVLFLAIGAALFFLSGVLARFALPVPTALRCPRCRYALERLAGPICPECGLHLDDEFTNAAASAGRLAPPTAPADSHHQ